MNPYVVTATYNPSTGNVDKIIHRIVTMAATTNVVSDGYTLPVSVEYDSDGKKFVRVTLNFVSDSARPKFDVPTPVSHVIEITPVYLESIIGFDENTYVFFDKKLNGNPLPSERPDLNCQSIVKCKWIENSGYPFGGYWYCIAYVSCDWGHGAYEVVVK